MNLRLARLWPERLAPERTTRRGISPAWEDAWQRPWHDLLEASRLLATDRPRARFLLERAAERAKADGLVSLLLESQLLATLVERHEPASASLSLIRALEIAAPSRIVRPFLECGRPMRDSLVQLRNAACAAPELLSHADKILKAFPPTGGLRALSQRERQILELISDGFSNDEIAERLAISLPTVKTHIGNMFAKLGARNRTGAVSMGRASGLLA